MQDRVLKHETKFQDFLRGCFNLSGCIFLSSLLESCQQIFNDYIRLITQQACYKLFQQLAIA